MTTNIEFIYTVINRINDELRMLNDYNNATTERYIDGFVYDVEYPNCEHKTFVLQKKWNALHKGIECTEFNDIIELQDEVLRLNTL